MNRAETEVVGNEGTGSRVLEDVRIPSYTILSYPKRLFQEKSEGKKNSDRPKETALEAIKLGALADRGFVFQFVAGLEPIELHASDFPALPINSSDSEPIFSMDSSIVKFLRPKTRLLDGDKAGNVTPDDVRDWFLRVVMMRERFMQYKKTRKLLSLIVNKQKKPLSTVGIVLAWNAAGLPSFTDPNHNQGNLSILGRIQPQSTSSPAA